VATAELTVIPLGREGASAGDLIAEFRRRLNAQDRVRFRMGAMLDQRTDREQTLEEKVSSVEERLRDDRPAGRDYPPGD
jgi:uncharacterized protein YqgV (UPF0045/DUF77 family)